MGDFFKALTGSTAKNASLKAGEKIQEAADAANTIQEEQGAITGSILNPYNASGAGAATLAADLTGANGPEAQAAAQATQANSPSQQFAQQQGLLGLENELAGRVGGGTRLASILKMNAGLASQNAQQNFNNLTNVRDSAQAAGTSLAGFGENNAAGRAQTTVGAGANQANSIIGAAQNQTSALGNLVGAGGGVLGSYLGS